MLHVDALNHFIKHLFTAKSSNCSILCLGYKLLTYIILYSYVKHITDVKSLKLYVFVAVINRAGLTYLGRVCTVLVGSPHNVFHRKLMTFLVVVISIHFSHTSMTNFSMTVFTTALWWGLQCGGACSRAHNPALVIKRSHGHWRSRQ